MPKSDTQFKKGNPGGKVGRKARKTVFREYVKLVANSKNIDPKAFMLGVVGDNKLSLDLRLIAARDVIPYTHKKMPQAVELDANIKLRTDFASAVAEDDVPSPFSPSAKAPGQ